MKTELEFLFGSRTRWRLIKFFLLNEKKELSAKELTEKNKLEGKETGPILLQLHKAHFLVQRRRGKKGNAYSLNQHFPFYQELKNLVIKSNVYPQCESLSKIKHMGDIRLAMISGAFINFPKAKTDLLIVGDNISKAKFKHLIEDLEAEIGREINYSLMNMTEFKYRVNMFDKFIMEIMEAPHEIVLNKVSTLLREVNIKK